MWWACEKQPRSSQELPIEEHYFDAAGTSCRPRRPLSTCLSAHLRLGAKLGRRQPPTQRGSAGASDSRLSAGRHVELEQPVQVEMDSVDVFCSADSICSGSVPPAEGRFFASLALQKEVARQSRARGRANGLEQQLERGSSMSGGQEVLLALSNVLHDPTSALDPHISSSLQRPPARDDVPRERFRKIPG